MAIDRRLLLKHAAALPLLGTVPPFSCAASENEAVKADYTLRIAPVTLELAPGKTIRTRSAFPWFESYQAASASL